MRLLELKLTDFKGLRDFRFSPQGENATLCGSNGTGKTTVFDAYTWLLCGQGSDPDARGFSPKPTDEHGNELHGLDSCVEGSFLLDNGDTLTLCKTLREEWTAKKGSSEKLHTGNRTSCCIDGVPVSLSEYERRLALLCKEDKASPLCDKTTPQCDKTALLTRPLCFSTTLHWQDRRKILLELCGDVSDAEVLASSPLLLKLPALLQRPNGGYYSTEEWRTRATAQLKTVQERLRELPQRLDEVQRCLIKLPAQTQEELSQRRAALSKERDRLLLADRESERERSIAAEELALAQDAAAFERQKNEELRVCRQLSAAVTAKRQAVQGRQLTAEVLLRGQKNEQIRLNDERKRLENAISETENSAFDGETHCPTCSQPLPPERIAKAREAFAAHKEQRLQNLRTELAELQPQRLAADIEKTAAELASLQKQLAELTSQEKQQLAALSAAEKRLFPDTASYAAHEQTLNRLRASKPDHSALETLTAQLQEVDRLSADLRAGMERQARFAELQAESEMTEQTLERLNRGLALCDLFIKAKVALLTERINAHFKTVRFRLFERQLNGGIRECCEVLARTSRGLKLFADANAGARLCAGLEIINTLSEKWGVSLPVFVDNAESVVRLPDIRPQLIRLQVSASDAALRAQYADNGLA